MDNTDSTYNYVTVSHPECEIVEEAVFTMIRRSQDGLKKFGCNMANAQMSAYQAIVNAREEAMDQVIYLTKAMYEMNKAMKQGDEING